MSPLAKSKQPIHLIHPNGRMVLCGMVDPTSSINLHRITTDPEQMTCFFCRKWWRETRATAGEDVEKHE